MPLTPSQRTTRSSSNPNNSATLSDVKSWIDNAESRILSSLRSDLEGISEKLSSLSRRLEEVEARNSGLEERCQVLERKNAILSTQLSELKEMPNALKSELLEESLVESQGRMIRQQNIVIQGLQESDAGSLDDRHRHDIVSVKRVVCKLGVTDEVISDVRRVGRKRRDGARLVVVRMADIHSKRRLLANAKSLKNSPSFKHVYVKPDLTPMQQAIEKRLRDELRERRTKGENVVIFRGSVRSRSDLQNFQ